MIDRRKKILVIGRPVQETFSSSEWTEIGYLTRTDEWIDRHPRLLRSLNWGDPDYKGCAMDAVAHILDHDPENLKHLIEYHPIADWLNRNDPATFLQLQSEVTGIQDVPEVVPERVTDAGLAALADAQELLRTRGPTSAVDRVHTDFRIFSKRPAMKRV